MVLISLKFFYKAYCSDRAIALTMIEYNIFTILRIFIVHRICENTINTRN